MNVLHRGIGRNILRYQQLVVVAVAAVLLFGLLICPLAASSQDFVVAQAQSAHESGPAHHSHRHDDADPCCQIMGHASAIIAQQDTSFPSLHVIFLQFSVLIFSFAAACIIEAGRASGYSSAPAPPRMRGGIFSTIWPHAPPAIHA